MSIQESRLPLSCCHKVFPMYTLLKTIQHHFYISVSTKRGKKTWRVDPFPFKGRSRGAYITSAQIPQTRVNNVTVLSCKADW